MCAIGIGFHVSKFISFILCVKFYGIVCENLLISAVGSWFIVLSIFKFQCMFEWTICFAIDFRLNALLNVVRSTGFKAGVHKCGKVSAATEIRFTEKLMTIREALLQTCYVCLLTANV